MEFNLWLCKERQSLKCFCDQQDIVDHKARGIELIQDLDFSIQYHKGSINIVVVALNHTKEVNMLSFT